MGDLIVSHSLLRKKTERERERGHMLTEQEH